jgi:hypothetical protein
MSVSYRIRLVQFFPGNGVSTYRKVGNGRIGIKPDGTSENDSLYFLESIRNLAAASGSQTDFCDGQKNPRKTGFFELIDT